MNTANFLHTKHEMGARKLRSVSGRTARGAREDGSRTRALSVRERW